jgi:putative cardiolipin synthase
MRTRNPLLLALVLLVAACVADEPSPLSQLDAPVPDTCGPARVDLSPSLRTALLRYEPLLATKTGVYVLEDGDGAMITRAWLAQKAERTIDVQYFIFSADNVGLIAADYLVRAAERGVRVRLLVDDLLVEADAEALVALDAQPNLEIRIYNPGVNIGTTLPSRVFKAVSDFRGINQRMHNKTFTVDGQVTITGGRNIADEYFDYDSQYNFRDRDVMLVGGVVSDVTASFERFWNDSLSVPVASLVRAPVAGRGGAMAANAAQWLHNYACDTTNYWPQVRARLDEIPAAFEWIQASGALQFLDGVTYVTDEPGKNDGTQGLGGGSPTLDTLVALVRAAKRSITIQTPYLVTTDLGREVLRDAVARGVSVRILTNSLGATDNFEAFNGYSRDRAALLATGVRVFEFRPDAAVRTEIMTGALGPTLARAPVFGLHAKSMVIDGEITVIGTFNVDPRSANLNTECLTVIRSESVASSVLRGMEIELRPENAWEVTPGNDPDAYAPLTKRLKAWTRGVVPKRIL